MADQFRTYDVELTITKTVRVRVPLDEKITNGDAPEKVAEEFATGGKALWPEWVISEDEDLDIDSVREVVPA